MEYKPPYLYLLNLARGKILCTAGFYMSVKEAKVTDWIHNAGREKREKTKVKRKWKEI